jgi:predicted nucleic acid-binding protein
MSVLVVDTSALGALLFGEPRAEEMAEALSHGPIVAPALLWFELTSVCLRKLSIYPKQKEQILTAFLSARQLAIEVVEVNHPEVIELARETSLTSYDASYLWLALHLKGELITLDKKLLKAAYKQRSNKRHL